MPRGPRPLPRTLRLPAHALVEEEVILGCAVGQGAVVRVAHGLVEREEHRLAGVDRGRRLAVPRQRRHGAEDVWSDGTGHVVKSAI